MIPTTRRTLFGWLGLAAAPLPAVKAVAATQAPAEQPVDIYGHRPAYAAPIGYAQTDHEMVDPVDHLFPS
jgi:hypothetical protein